MRIIVCTLNILICTALYSQTYSKILEPFDLRDNIMTDIMNVPQENAVFENGYIPMGLYEDLADNVVDPVWRVRDNVMGYTTEQMSNGMNANVTTVAEYRDFLSPLLPAGNTQQALTDLFDDYQ